MSSLWDGYRLMQRAILPTAVSNLVGLPLDEAAHRDLVRKLGSDMARMAVELDAACGRGVANHGSTPLVSRWIVERVLGHPIKPPDEPRLVGLTEFLRRAGGVRPNRGGELASLDLSVVRLDGRLSAEDAVLAAWEAGYIGHEHDRWSDDGTRPELDDLVRGLEEDQRGERCLTTDDAERWREFCEARQFWEDLHVEEPLLKSQFSMRLHARTRGAVKTWRWTGKTGHLAITKGSQARKAEQLADAFPDVAGYLVTRVRWNKLRKLVDGFGPALLRWLDDDGRVRGQFKVWSAWTGRQSCVNPNLQQQPREPEFRALWRALPGRKLVVADYSQIELRLLAIESGDERLREVYRRGLDVHAETARWAFGVAEPTKEQRQAAKAINFGIAYGCGAAGLSEAGGFSLEESSTILARVLGAYPGLARYRERMPREAAALGYITIKPGRRVAYTSRSPGTTAINAPIQGGAASVQMRALRLVHDALRVRPDFDALLAASVHDEIILDSAEGCAAEAAALLVDCMTRALVEIYPEAEDMGMARLTAASICDRWSDKA